MLKEFLAKIFGGYLEKKAELYDGTPTEGKAWYKSKAILAGIIVLLRGVYEGASAIMVQSGHAPLPSVPPVVDSILGIILGGAAIKGRVEANQPIVAATGLTPTDQKPS
jgi:hypothetical protein